MARCFAQIVRAGGPNTSQRQRTTAWKSGARVNVSDDGQPKGRSTNANKRIARSRLPSNSEESESERSFVALAATSERAS